MAPGKDRGRPGGGGPKTSTHPALRSAAILQDHADRLLLALAGASIDGLTRAVPVSTAAARVAYIAAQLEELNLVGAFEPWEVAA